MVAGADLRHGRPQLSAPFSRWRISLRIHHHQSGPGLIPTHEHGPLPPLPVVPPAVAPLFQALAPVRWLATPRVSFHAAALMMDPRIAGETLLPITRIAVQKAAPIYRIRRSICKRCTSLGTCPHDVRRRAPRSSQPPRRSRPESRAFLDKEPKHMRDDSEQPGQMMRRHHVRH